MPAIISATIEAHGTRERVINVINLESMSVRSGTNVHKPTPSRDHRNLLFFSSAEQPSSRPRQRNVTSAASLASLG